MGGIDIKPAKIVEKPTGKRGDARLKPDDARMLDFAYATVAVARGAGRDALSLPPDDQDPSIAPKGTQPSIAPKGTQPSIAPKGSVPASIAPKGVGPTSIAPKGVIPRRTYWMCAAGHGPWPQQFAYCPYCGE